MIDGKYFFNQPIKNNKVRLYIFQKIFKNDSDRFK